MQCQLTTRQTSTSSVMDEKMFTTYKSIWRPSPASTLLWLQICQKKCASTAQEGQPQDYPQQAAHPQQSIKETRVRSLIFYVTCKQIAITRKQRMLIGERKRNFVWREKRSVKQGNNSTRRRNTSTVNGNVPD